MYLESIRLIKIKGLDDLELHLTEKENKISLWNCIFAENGLGKTTLLQSIASQLIPFNFYLHLNQDTEQWVQQNQAHAFIFSQKNLSISPKK